MQQPAKKRDFSGGFDLPAVIRVLEQVARDSFVEDDREIHDIAFHMTDWAYDLRDLFELYSKPDAFSKEEAKRIVSGFLVHVPNHVAAAGKLLMDDPVSDIFGVGAVKQVEE